METFNFHNNITHKISKKRLFLFFFFNKVLLLLKSQIIYDKNTLKNK